MISLKLEALFRFLRNVFLEERINIIENPDLDDEIYIVAGKNKFKELQKIKDREGIHG